MRRKEMKKNYGREHNEVKVATTETKDWSNFRGMDPMKQNESGSMDYLRRKDSLADSDDKIISRFKRNVRSIKE